MIKIGIIGGGQLGQMLALAALPLGIKVICLEKTRDCPAAQVATVLEGEYDDINKLQELANQVDILTYEFENVSVETLRKIKKTPIYPPLPILEIAQERVAEKNFFNRCGIPTVKFAPINNYNDLKMAAKNIGFPAIIKTCRLGYDGKGQHSVATMEDLDIAWKQFQNQPLIYEQKINFDYEVSMLGVRSVTGEITYYPLAKNQHREGILYISQAPFSNDALTAQAISYVRTILEASQYVGVLAIEFFVKDGKLFANEMAPRVHNSGHWTMEGAVCSQFENHIRAICGLPLGATTTYEHCTMINLISEAPPLIKILKIPGAHLHLYGKTPKPKRKLGHITVCSPNVTELSLHLEQLIQLIN